MAINFPNTPTNGQVFTDPNGSNWTYETATNSWTAEGAGPLGGGLSVQVSETAPTAPSVGDLWFRSSTKELFIYEDDGLGTTKWTLTNPDVPSASETVAGRVELATAAETTAGTDNTRAVHPAGLKVALDKKANLNSPALTGVPTAPTAASGTSTTQIATTEFVQTSLASSGSGFKQASKSGTHSTTGNVITIPAGVKQIDIYYVNTSGPAVHLRLGTGGAIVSSVPYSYTYSKFKGNFTSPVASLGHNASDSLINLGGEAAAVEISLHLFNDSGTHWTVRGTARNANGASANNTFLVTILGDVDIGGELDRVAIGTFSSSLVDSTMTVLYA
jgi:hypothetical protein